MYRHGKGVQPWLNMVKEFGGDWNTLKRCDAIAERLEGFRQDGLRELTYRDDPNTPKQAVICAKTKLSGDNCPLLVTLAPGVDAYEALRKGTGVDQGSQESFAGFSRSSPIIVLEGLLGEENP